MYFLSSSEIFRKSFFEAPEPQGKKYVLMRKHPVFAKRDSKATLNSLPLIGFSHTAFRSQRGGGGGRRRRERDSLSLFPLQSWGQKEEEEEEKEELSDLNEGWDSPNNLRKQVGSLTWFSV